LARSVEQMADALIIMDRSGVMEYVNPAFEALTGYSRQKAIGQTLRMLKSEQQAGDLYDEMWNTVCSGNVFRGIMMNRKKNEETLIIENVLTPLRAAAGKSRISPPPSATSPSDAGWSRNCNKHRKWMPLADWPAGWPTISTTCFS
jgi:PAS domain S-box-containing protein